MATKKQIRCEFTGVGLQIEHRTIGVKFSRDNLSLDTADEYFAGHRLTGTVEVVRSGEADGQQHLVQGDLSKVKASFDVKRFAVTPEEISCKLVFAKDDIDPETLDGFMKRSGRIIITKSEEIPEKEEEEE